MSIFDDSDTLCERTNNHCKRRNKCHRYLANRDKAFWAAGYWQEFGQFCDYFIPETNKAA